MYVKERTLQYDKGMKRLILAAALLLTAVSANSTLQRFSDPIPECPPACSEVGNDDIAH